MKLDKIRFAVMASWIGTFSGRELKTSDLIELDDIVDIAVPQPDVYNTPSTQDVNTLMALMTEGTQKIEAIKVHRKLTGCGLKESKDQVEKHWVSKGHYNPSAATLGDILAAAKGVG